MLLPYDVIAQVVSHAQEPVLHSLCLTSHCVHHLASRELYRTLDFDRRDMRPVQCLQSIKDSPHLGIMVTSLRLRLFRDFPAILPLFVSALKLMPALRKLHILDVASIVKAYPEVAEVIAGLTELTEFSFRLNATTTEIMTPLLMRLGRMTLVHARTASPLNERHLGVEHLLRVSADTLEELVLYNFPLVDYLRAQPHLRFSRATRLDLNSHCTSWGPEIARAFPHLRQITLNASVIQPLELLEDARNFPQLDFANVRIDRVRIRAQQHATRRNLPHVVLYSTTPTSSLIPDVLGFFGLLQCERLRSIRIPLFVHSNDALAVLLEVCSLCPNLQCVCAPLAHHSSLIPELVRVLGTYPLLSMRFFSVPWYDATNKNPLPVQAVAERMDELGALLPSLSVFELRLEPPHPNVPTYQFRHLQTGDGVGQWVQRSGADLAPPEGFAFMQ